MGNQAVKKLIDFLKENSPAPGLPIEALRENFENFYCTFKADFSPIVEHVSIGKIGALWVRASESVANDTAILFFHGGGYSIGSVASHMGLCAMLSKESNTTLLGINYRKAPEHPFPAALEDCMEAYFWLLEQGYGPGQIILAGILAGANLVLATLLALKEENKALPAAAVCLSPVADFLFQSPSLKKNAAKDWILVSRLEAIRDMYVAGEDPNNPLISPLYGDLKGLPPLLMQAGGDEILLDDTLRFAKKAEEEGVDITLQVSEEMVHCWHIFFPRLPAGLHDIREVGKFVRKTFAETALVLPSISQN